MLNNNLVKFSCFLALFGACSVIGLVKYLVKKEIVEPIYSFQGIKRNQIIFEEKSVTKEPNSSFTICKEPTINEFPQDFIPFKDFKYASMFFKKKQDYFYQFLKNKVLLKG